MKVKAHYVNSQAFDDNRATGGPLCGQYGYPEDNPDRVTCMNCLYKMGKIKWVDRYDPTIPRKGSTVLVINGWKIPKGTVGKVLYHGKPRTSNDFRSKYWFAKNRYRCLIEIEDAMLGKLQVWTEPSNLKIIKQADSWYTRNGKMG